MTPSTRRVLSLPRGMPVTRYQPKPEVEVPPQAAETPLFDKDTPPDQRIQQIWTARVRVFDLNDDTQREAYELVWQRVCDGTARMCEHRMEFDGGRYQGFLRWVELGYKFPEGKAVSMTGAPVQREAPS